MPRRAKSARLWLRPETQNAGKGLRRAANWVILDRGNHIATSCLAHETAKAETCLAAYIAQKYQPSRQRHDIDEIDVADVISIYVDDRKLQESEGANKLFARLERLNEFWGAKKLAEVNGETCREYARQCGTDGSARRDLEDLRAAINHHAKEGYHRGVVRVVLPPKGKSRDRWLTRKEAADLVRACWRAEEIQTIHRGLRKGQLVGTGKRPLRHLARFILIGLYTGTRAAAIASAAVERGNGRSFVDLDNGIFYRLAEGKRETKKRQPPVPIPPRLLAHLRRWQAKGIIRQHVVEWNGEAVKSVKTAFKSAVALAGLCGRVTPHTLRHTAATWLMQAGVDKWEAAGFLGMTVEMLDRVYGHHHPQHLKKAARSIGYRHENETLAVSLAQRRPAKTDLPQPIEIVGGPAWTRTRNQTVMSGRL
jgi:integrase